MMTRCASETNGFSFLMNLKSARSESEIIIAIVKNEDLFKSMPVNSRSPTTGSPRVSKYITVMKAIKKLHTKTG